LSNAAHPMGFWTGLKANVIDKKHVLKMGAAIWLFAYLTTRQTALNRAGEGVVNYGHPLTFDTIHYETKGIPSRTIRRWVAVLKREKYIRTAAHGKNGLVFWIAKAKHKTKLKRIDSRPIVAASRVSSGPEVATSDRSSLPRVAASVERNDLQVTGYQGETAERKGSITTSLTPKDLPSLQQDTAAQIAASPTSLLNERAKVQSKPQQLSPKPAPKPADSELLAWQDRHAERDPASAEYRKAYGL
jgi:hypothetical protein